MIEAVLAVFAWKKGWRSMALIPVGVALTFGVICAAAGFPFSVAIVGDLICSGVLIAMIVRGPSSVAEAKPVERQYPTVQGAAVSHR